MPRLYLLGDLGEAGPPSTSTVFGCGKRWHQQLMALESCFSASDDEDVPIGPGNIHNKWAKDGNFPKLWIKLECLSHM